jgi:hypothetical protein
MAAIKRRWFWIPVRILLVTFLLSLLVFALCLLLGIVGLTINGAVRGIHPNMTLAYRAFAFPVASVAGAVALFVAIVLEFREPRET